MRYLLKKWKRITRRAIEGAHIGVDAESGLTHTLVATAGNVSDVTQAHALLHGDERVVFGDARYQGVEKRKENRGTEVIGYVRRLASGQAPRLAGYAACRVLEGLEQARASIRAKVERPFHVVKNLFSHGRTRHRGLEEHGAAADAVRPGQSDDRQATAVGAPCQGAS
jgi:IS5 family transposase